MTLRRQVPDKDEQLVLLVNVLNELLCFDGLKTRCRCHCWERELAPMERSA